jgi:hypothetical protein
MPREATYTPPKIKNRFPEGFLMAIKMPYHWKPPFARRGDGNKKRNAEQPYQDERRACQGEPKRQYPKPHQNRSLMRIRGIRNNPRILPSVAFIGGR